MITYYIKDSRKPYMRSVVAKGHCLKEVDDAFEKRFPRPARYCPWAYYEIVIPKNLVRTATMRDVLEHDSEEAQLATMPKITQGRGRVIMQDENGFETNMFRTDGTLIPA